MRISSLRDKTSQSRECAHNLFAQTLLIGLTLTIFLLSSQTALAQGEGGDDIWSFDAVLTIEHLDTADLNGDNVPDVIVGEYNSQYYGEISRVYGIDGTDGGMLWVYVLNDGVRAMTTGDINNDGVPDAIAGASYNTSGTADGKVHAIDGTNGQKLWDYPINASILDVAIGDLNGDQYMDVAVGSLEDFVYAIDGQDGSMLWTEEIGSLWINAVATGDVNGDMIDDVAFAHEYLSGFSNHVGVLDGTDGSVIWDSVVTRVNLSIEMFDIDGDSQLEVIIGAVDDSDIGSVRVRDAATGAPEWAYQMGTVDGTNGEVFLFFEEVDDDSDTDLLVSTYLGPYEIFVFEGDSNVPMMITDPLDGFPRDIVVGDVAGNGVRNIVAAAYDRVQVMSADDGSLLWHFAVAGSIRAVGLGDFDEDSELEIYAAGGANFSDTPPDPGEAVWGIETVESPLLWEHQFGAYGNAIAVGDLNGDQYMDVAVVDSDNDQVTAIDGVTGGELWRWNSTANLYAVTIGDFDNNGSEDVAVAGDDEQVTAIVGSTGAQLWQFPDPTDQIYRGCLASADLDGNGTIDVVAGADDNFVCAISGADGSQLWAKDLGGNIGEVEVATVPGTNDIKVAVAVEGGPSGEQVALLKPASGDVEWSYTTTAEANYVEALDVNNDSILDLAAGVTPFSRRVQMIDGATQTLLWDEPYPVNSNGHGFGHGDLNGDGNDDLVVPGGSSTNKIYAVNGLTGDTLWTFDCGDELNCIDVADMNNDDIPDIIAGGEDQTVYIIDGMTGDEYWSYSVSGEIIDIALGDIDGLNSPNVACVTFDFDGIAYAFKSFFADTVTSCCMPPSRGNVDGSGDGSVTINDLTVMVDFLFISLTPLTCWEEGNVDESVPEGPTSVTLADLTVLIDHLFISLDPLPPCP
ncbi:PQQ-binding-like beta-propeller repeat protein [candidate division GN15 bacterium]|nr:PQQ-binding-like beta-propeller repeat protein [candidate division GN15 bacterium]